MSTNIKSQNDIKTGLGSSQNYKYRLNQIAPEEDGKVIDILDSHLDTHRNYDDNGNNDNANEENINSNDNGIDLFDLNSRKLTDNELLNDFYKNIEIESKYKSKHYHANNLIQHVPFLNSLLGWSRSRKRRLSEPPDLKIMVPGIFNQMIMKDVLTFRWLIYLDEDNTVDNAIDMRIQYQNEYTNIGLLAALVFTVWVSFQISSQAGITAYFPYPYSFRLQSVYSILWTVCAALTLFSTITAVLMLLAINETSCSDEATHFMDSLNDSTFGIGSLMPIIFLTTSVLVGAVGTTLWFFLTYDSKYIAFSVFLSLMFTAGMFGIILLNVVVHLYTARETQKAINNLPQLYLSHEAIVSYLNKYINEIKGIKYLSGEDDFINWLREHISRQEIISNELSKKKNLTNRERNELEQSIKALKFSKEATDRIYYRAKLSYMTDKLARSLYNDIINDYSSKIVKLYHNTKFTNEIEKDS